MSLVKTRIFTICTYNYLESALKIFDDAVKNDPTISTTENRCLRQKFDDVLDKSFFGICIYNSKKMIRECQ